MALQSSGAISIDDIRTELGSSSGSLRTLSAAAGKSTPDAISEFYGYASATPPSVLFDGTTAISPTSLRPYAQITNDNGSTVTERGFYVGTNSSSPTSNTKYIQGSGTGSYNLLITGLNSSTVYYVWAYGTNAGGTTFSARYTKTTLPPYISYSLVPTSSNTKQPSGLPKYLGSWACGYAPNFYGGLGGYNNYVQLNQTNTLGTPITITGSMTSNPYGFTMGNSSWKNILGSGLSASGNTLTIQSGWNTNSTTNFFADGYSSATSPTVVCSPSWYTIYVRASIHASGYTGIAQNMGRYDWLP